MHAIEEELQSRFRLLRFGRVLETSFERDTSDERCRSLAVGNWVGLVVYHLFLIGDCKAIPDALHLDLFLHFGVMTPVAIMMNVILSRRPSAALREVSMMASTIILALTIVVVVAASASPVRDLVQFTIVLVVLFATVMQRLRFWYAVLVCLAAQALYSIGLAAIVPFSIDRVVMSNCIVAGVVIFSLVGCYKLEHEMRTGYLLRLRDSRRHRDLETISLQDPLTGIGNRRALDAALRAASDRSAGAPRRPTAVLLLDIDHFKTFNDTNGHQAGDMCLARIAGLVALTLGGTEGAVYRFGGEEFVVVLDDTRLSSALDAGERIRAAIAKAAIPRGDGGKAVVTVSIGAAAGFLGQSATPKSLIAGADRALYVAKGRGRNLVWPEAEPVPAEAQRKAG